MLFPNPLQPIPRLHIAAIDFLRYQNIASKIFTPIGWPFSVQPIPAQRWRGGGRQILKIYGKNSYINTLYIPILKFHMDGRTEGGN